MADTRAETTTMMRAGPGAVPPDGEDRPIAGSPPPSGQPAAGQGAEMVAERLGRHLQALLCGQLCCGLGGGGGGRLHRLTQGGIILHPTQYGLR